MKAPKQLFLPIAGLALLCVVAYSNSFHVPFQFDDDRLIRFNFSLRNLKDWSGVVHSEFFRPLTMLSLALNFQLSQKNPVSYHVVNLLLHVTTTILLFRILCRLSPDRLFCWFAAALFSVHPFNTEAVTYISSRSILLCAVFSLLALLAFDSHIRRPRFYHAALFGMFFFLAALSKEEAGVIPFSALLYNLTFFGAASVKRHKWLHLSSILIVLCAFLFRLQSELTSAGGLPFEFSVYWPTEIFVWLQYLWFVIFPVALNVDHSVTPLTFWSPAFWISAVVVVLILASLIRLWVKRQPLPAFWGMWFFLNLLPSSVIPLNDFMAEHRVYLSLMGFCVLVSSALIWIRRSQSRRPVILVVSLVALTLFYSSVTFARNRVWSSKLTLWYDATLKSPAKYRPHINLAYALFEVGAVDEAIREYLIARSLSPNIARIHAGLGFCYLKKGALGEALQSFRKAFVLEPNYLDAKTGLGIVFYRQNQFREALFFFEEALPYRQESPELVAMMAICYLQTEQREKALTLIAAKEFLDVRLKESSRLLRDGSEETARQILADVAKL